MKAALCCLVGVLCVQSALGQGGGIVVFNNRVPLTVIAPIFGPDPSNPYLSLTGNPTNGFPIGTQMYSGPKLEGSNYFAQMFCAPGLNQSANALVAQSPITIFRTGAPAGFVVPTSITANNLVPESTGGATVQIRVWDNSTGQFPSWQDAEPAWQAGSIAAGESLIFNVTDQIGSPLVIPPNLSNLQSFNIYFIAEPEVAALAGLGVLAFGVRALLYKIRS